MSGPRIVLFGIRCAFTDAVLRRLVAAGQNVVALVLPGPPGLRGAAREPVVASTLPMAGSATRPAIPTVRVGRLTDAGVIDTIASFEPEIILVACFPRRVPSQLLRVARVAALNLHPSLLPRHRGPDPLFWTLRHGDPLAVTLHDLVADLDAGPVVAQRVLEVPDGLAEAELERELAEAGAGLFVESVPALVDGSVSRTPQDEAAASYESWPSETDYVVDVGMPVRDAFRFLRAFAGRPAQLAIALPHRRVPVERAVRYGRGTAPDDRSGLIVPFADGWLEVIEVAADAGAG